jgi:glycerol-3-phosphate cytidylyltransferase
MTRYRCAYIGGTFDCLHRGHLALFANARKQLSDRIVVSLNTDEFAARYKRKPLMPLADRLAVVSACRLVDLAIVNTGDEDSRDAIERSGADCIIHGSDWFGDSLMQQMGFSQAWLDARGISLVTLPYTQITSTTEILNRFHEQVQAVGGGWSRA